MIYESTITNIGEDVEGFLDEKMIVLFNENVPDELQSIAVVHEDKPMNGDVSVGDYFTIGETEYEVLWVGTKANETLHELGHCTIKFSSTSDDELPGTIVVEEKPIHPLQAGTTISFRKK